jgi:hypothetical protein
VNPAAALFAALAGIPALPGAACRNRHQLFDGVEPADVAEAVTICETECPALAACAAWADSLPANSLSGVVAGELHVWLQQAMGRPRKAVAS